MWHICVTLAASPLSRWWQSDSFEAVFAREHRKCPKNVQSSEFGLSWQFTHELHSGRLSAKSAFLEKEILIFDTWVEHTKGRAWCKTQRVERKLFCLMHVDNNEWGFLPIHNTFFVEINSTYIWLCVLWTWSHAGQNMKQGLIILIV